MHQPPDRLPQGFRNVWQAIRDADTKAPSRRFLAHELGVSSFTLHRILISGDVPDLASASIREQRAWIRTLARMAHRLRLPARPWIEEAGIEWTAAVERLVSTVTGRELQTEAQLPSGTPGWWQLTEPLRTLDIGVGRLPGPGTGPGEAPGLAPGRAPGTMTRAGGSLPTADRDSFLGTLAQRILRALAPGARVRYHRETPATLAAGILDGRLDLAVGVWDTPHARRTGLHMVPIPGLTIPLRAFSETPRRESWSTLVAHPAARFIVEPGAPAGDYLRVHCGVPSERIREHDGVASDISTVVDAIGGTASVLVVDAWSAWHIERSRTSEPLEEIYGLASEEALVRLAVAVPKGADALAAVVTHLLDHEFLSANPRRTAELYALLLDAPVSDLGDPERAHLHRAARSVRLSGLPAHADLLLLRVAELIGEQAGSLFPEDACERLARNSLRNTTFVVTKDRTDPYGSSEDHAALGPTPKEGPTESVPTTIVVEATAKRHPAGPAGDPTVAPMPGRCQSCSEPLSRSGGVSPYYCRYCSSEDGELRSLSEVQAILRHWMLTWQSGVNEGNVDERVRHFMKSMPAWADRV